MEEQQTIFSGKTVAYYFGEKLSALSMYVHRDETILIVDDKVAALHGDKLGGWTKIIVEGAETSKSLDCFQKVIDELIRLGADRQTVLVGVGGGVVSDLTGFVASVYMRGLRYAFVPTTLLAQVDAAIGGKNGVNYDRYKNILGIIRQPEFLLFDYDLLDTLEEADLYNGFAEIIKYACICDASLFTYLERNRENALSRNREVIRHLVRRSVEIKSQIVSEDEFEGGRRRVLNFGHTIGHAVEKLEQIPHGQAVAKGMVIASQISSVCMGFPAKEAERLKKLIFAYHLPVSIDSDPAEIEKLLKMDKKREKDFVHFILLKKLGEAEIKPVLLSELSELLRRFLTTKTV